LKKEKRTKINGREENMGVILAPGLALFCEPTTSDTAWHQQTEFSAWIGGFCVFLWREVYERKGKTNDWITDDERKRKVGICAGLLAKMQILGCRIKCDKMRINLRKEILGVSGSGFDRLNPNYYHRISV
jgi:hypothetical protein